MMFLEPDEALILYRWIIRGAEMDLKREHQYITKRWDLVEALLKGTAKLDKPTRKKAERIMASLKDWRETRDWFLRSRRFEEFCLVCNISPGRKREDQKEFMNFEASGLQIENAVKDYYKDVRHVRIVGRRNARAWRKKARRMGDQSRAAVAGLPGSDATSAGRTGGVRGDEAPESGSASGPKARR